MDKSGTEPVKVRRRSCGEKRVNALMVDESKAIKQENDKKSKCERERERSKEREREHDQVNDAANCLRFVFNLHSMRCTAAMWDKMHERSAR